MNDGIDSSTTPDDGIENVTQPNDSTTYSQDSKVESPDISSEEWAKRINEEKESNSSPEAPKNPTLEAETPPEKDTTGSTPCPPKLEQIDNEVDSFVLRNISPPKEETTELKSNNVSAYTKLVTGPVEAMFENAEKQFNDSPAARERLNELMKDPNSDIRRMYDIATAYYDIHNKQQSLMVDLVTDIKDTLTSLPDTVVDKIARKSAQHGRVDGRVAKLLTIAHVGGIRKLPLLNSGFNVKLRPFTILELQSFYNTVDMTASELGRTIGGAAYHILDHELKQLFMSFFAASVVDSNLEGWQDENTMLNNISFHDYDVCVWAVCSLMFKKGIETTLYCADLKCKFKQMNYLVDINKMRLNNLTLIPADELEHQMTLPSVTPELLSKWRDRKEFRAQHVYNIDDNEAILRYDLQVPTIASYLKSASWLSGELKKLLNEDFDLKSEKSYDLLVMSYYRTFIAWVKYVSAIDPADKKTVLWYTDDSDAIQNTLDPTLHENSSLGKDFHDFLKQTKMTYIGYTNVSCPSCGKQVDASIGVDDFMPLDCQLLFFALACRKIQVAGQL